MEEIQGLKTKFPNLQSTFRVYFSTSLTFAWVSSHSLCFSRFRERFCFLILARFLLTLTILIPSIQPLRLSHLKKKITNDSAWKNSIRWRQTAPWIKVFRRTSSRVSEGVSQPRRKNGRLRDRNMTWMQCTNWTQIDGSITWARRKANSRSNRWLTSDSRRHGT